MRLGTGSPRLSFKTLKHFYDYNKVPKSILYKDSKVRAKIVKPEPTPKPLKSDPISIIEEKQIQRLKELRREKNNKFNEVTDE